MFRPGHPKWDSFVPLRVSLRVPRSVKILFSRYSEASCESLIPTPKKEDFSKFNLGQDIMETDNEDEVTIQDPKELQARNPPFNLDLDFTRYRRGKTYQSTVLQI